MFNVMIRILIYSGEKNFARCSSNSYPVHTVSRILSHQRKTNAEIDLLATKPWLDYKVARFIIVV